MIKLLRPRDFCYGIYEGDAAYLCAHHSLWINSAGVDKETRIQAMVPTYG